jgi:hypothetical protein
VILERDGLKEKNLLSENELKELREEIKKL